MNSGRTRGTFPRNMRWASEVQVTPGASKGSTECSVAWRPAYTCLLRDRGIWKDPSFLRLSKLSLEATAPWQARACLRPQVGQNLPVQECTSLIIALLTFSGLSCIVKCVSRRRTHECFLSRLSISQVYKQAQGGRVTCPTFHTQLTTGDRRG